MTKKVHLTCGLLVMRRQADDSWRYQPCGAPTQYVLSIGGDAITATCNRHKERLAKLARLTAPRVTA